MVSGITYLNNFLLLILKSGNGNPHIYLLLLHFFPKYFFRSGFVWRLIHHTVFTAFSPKGTDKLPTERAFSSVTQASIYCMGLLKQHTREYCRQFVLGSVTWQVNKYWDNLGLSLKTWASTLPLIRDIYCLSQVVFQGLSYFGWDTGIGFQFVRSWRTIFYR
jgi:hypothetical protein